MRWYWSRVGRPSIHNWCPYKKTEDKLKADTQGEDSHVMTEAEIGVMQLQALILWPPPEVRKRQGRILPYRFQRQHVSANTLISDSRTMRE